MFILDEIKIGLSCFLPWFKCSKCSLKEQSSVVNLKKKESFEILYLMVFGMVLSIMDHHPNPYLSLNKNGTSWMKEQGAECWANLCGDQREKG